MLRTGSHANRRTRSGSSYQRSARVSNHPLRVMETYARIANVVFSDSKGASGSFEGRGHRLWPIMDGRAMRAGFGCFRRAVMLR